MSLRKRTQTKHRPSYTSNYTCCSEDTILENKYFFGDYISRCELWRTLLFAYPLCHCNEWTSPVCDHSLIRLSMSGQDRTGSLFAIGKLELHDSLVRKEIFVKRVGWIVVDFLRAHWDIFSDTLTSLFMIPICSTQTTLSLIMICLLYVNLFPFVFVSLCYTYIVWRCGIVFTMDS